MITTQDNERHRLLRFDMASKFSARAVLCFERAVDGCIDTFVRAMEQRCDEVVDLERWLQYWTGDVAAETALDERVGFMEKDADIRDVIQGLKFGFRYAASIGQVPGCHSWLVGNRGLLNFLKRFVGIPDPPGVYIEVSHNSLELRRPAHFKNR